MFVRLSQAPDLGELQRAEGDGAGATLGVELVEVDILLGVELVEVDVVLVLGRGLPRSPLR
jgi:hypothetical protein